MKLRPWVGNLARGLGMDPPAGFPRPRWGGHFSGHVQERILNLVVARDVRGTVLESPDIPQGEQPICSINEPGDPLPSCTPWEVLDNVNLEEEFQRRFHVLQVPSTSEREISPSCKSGIGGTSQCDHTMTLRAWKLFLLFPFMLLRNPRGARKVGDKFGRDLLWPISTLARA